LKHPARTSETEEKILSATLELISAKGYLGTTTREIARQAGVSEVTLFRHFSTKEKLFEAVLNKYSFLPRLKDTLVKLDGNREKLVDILYSIGLSFFETLQERKSLVRIMTCEINVYPEKVRKVYSNFIDQIISLLARYFDSLKEKGVIRDCPSRIISRAFLGMIYSYFIAEEIIKARVVPPEEKGKVIREFTGICIEGIGKS